jgi:cytochrome c oxidase assembly protein subunit 15
MVVNKKPGFRLALFGCAMAVVVIGLGAFTRLVDAGLGCPDWPGCYGHMLWPNEAHEVAAANAAFPDMPVEHDKTWPEMVHRYFASALGLLTIGLLAICWRERKSNPEQPIKLPAFLLAFIILQGLFGMWTVTLKLWPQVVTAHLLGGFTTFSLLWLMALRLSNRQWQLSVLPFEKLQRLKPLAAASLLVVILQIALGGWTTSNYAAVACPDLPTCQQQWLPNMDFAQGFDVFQHIGPNYLGGTMDNDARVAIHFSHRLGAVLTTLALAAIIIALLKVAAVAVNRQPAWAIKKLAFTIGALLTLQIALGLSNIVFNFPVSVAVAHNVVGALLLLSIVTLNYRLFSCQRLIQDA